MKRSVGHAACALGGVTVILAAGAGGLAFIGPARAQQPPAQQEQATQPAGEQPFELRPGQNPFAVPARNAARQRSPFGAQPEQQIVQWQLAAPAPQGGASASCKKLVALLTDRRDMMNKINESSKKHQKMDAPTACALFTQLAANGSETAKWMAANNDRCRVPDQLITNVENANEKVSNIRGQACKLKGDWLPITPVAGRRLDQRERRDSGGVARGLEDTWVSPPL